MYIILFISFIIFFVWVIPVYAINDSTPWCNTANCDVTWNFRKKITIDHTKVGVDNTSGTIPNFPILINFTGGNFSELKSFAESDARDLRFTDRSGNDLDWEIEQFDIINNKMAIWVQANSTGISKSSDTILYVYYRNPVDDEGVKFGTSASSTVNEPSVWDSSYTGVWHLDDTSFGNNSVDDSTNNGNLDAPTSSWDSSASVYGIASRAIEFDGTNAMSDGQVGDFYNDDGLAVEAWIKPDNVSVCKTVASAYKEQTGKKGWHMGVGCTSGKIYATISTDGTATTTYTGSNTIAAGNWQHIAITHDGTDFKLYHNGTLDQSASVATINVPTGITLHVGTTFDDINLFDGVLDELRISEAARSADYIKTTYNNLASPSTFYSIGVQDDGAPEIPTTRPMDRPERNTVRIFWDNISDSGAAALSYYRVLFFSNVHSLTEVNYTSPLHSPLAINLLGYYTKTTCSGEVSYKIRAVNSVRASNLTETVSLKTPACPDSTTPPDIRGVGIYDKPTNYYHQPDLKDPNYFSFEDYEKGHTVTVPTDTLISFATRIKYENSKDDIVSYGIYLNNREHYSSKESGETYIHLINSGISHKRTYQINQDSFEYTTLTITDKWDYFESVRYSEIINNDERWLVFNVIFKKPMEESDVIIDVWDKDRKSRILTLSGLEVIQKELEPEIIPYEITILDKNIDTCIQKCYPSLEITTNNNSITWKNNETVLHTIAITIPDIKGYYSYSNLEPSDSFTEYFTVKGTFDFKCIIHPWLNGSFLVKDKQGENIGQSVEITNELEIDKTESVARYAGFSEDIISDKEFLKSFGINADNAPKYLKKVAVYLYKDQISEKEFENVLEYLQDKHIIK